MNTRLTKRFAALLAVLFIMSSLFSFAIPAFAAEEADDTAAELPGYAVFVKDYEGEEYETNGEYASAYLGYYADAVQHDENCKENYEAAVAQVREDTSSSYATIWAIVPPVIAIVLALITKEVYSSLFLGILSGALLYANFNPIKTVEHLLTDGFVASLADSYNVGILIFLVVLGALVAMMNRAGGSLAFGRWASKNIKSRVGAQIATIILGCLIFVDDYFNCLTVGSVMKPVADANKISRAKLAYLIDATAAPVCIIAPISSWAAAVSGFAEGSGMNGLELFISAIPFNFYALLTILMMFTLAIGQFDYGVMRVHEDNARDKGDIFTTLDAKAEQAQTQNFTPNPKGRVIDLIIPVVVLIISCVLCMIYNGGFFSGASFAEAFSNCDASVGLSMGSLIALVIDIIYFTLIRFKLIKFSDCMGCLADGFKAMVPAILILTFAWTLKSMTDSLGAAVFIAEIVRNSASAFIAFLPAVVFLIAVGLSFATGTSWGTFGILIPIVLSALNGFDGNTTIIAISACMAGAVCGDHCSPISDTTIMASAGAECNHINHVNTQLPYAFTVAGVSFVTYIIAGFVATTNLSYGATAAICLAIGAVLMLATLLGIKAATAKKASK